MARTRSGDLSSRAIERFAKELAFSAQLSFDEHRTLAFAQRARKTLLRTKVAYRELLNNLNERVQATRGIEILLDNFYIAEGAITELSLGWKEKQTLRVPQLTDAEGGKQPRVYAVARALIKEVDAQLDRETIIEFLSAYQKNSPLSLRELDIFPDMLRFALIEEILRLIDASMVVLREKAEADRWYARIVSTRQHRDASVRLKKLTAQLAMKYTILPQAFGLHLLHRLEQAGKEGDIRPLSKWLKLSIAKQGANFNQLSIIKSRTEKAQAETVMNAISSLRYLAQVRWDKISLELNMVDAILGKDPTDTFRMLTDDTRSLYRQTIARIGDGTGTHDIEVAREAVRLAKQSLESKENSPRMHHVGYYLLDDGIALLEQALGYAPTPTERVRAFILKNSTNVYLGFIWIVSMLLTVVLITESGVGDLPLFSFYVMIFSGLLLTSEIATSLAQFVFTRVLRPRPIPALDLNLGVGSERRTIVVMPSMFRNKASAEKILRRMETNYVANADEHIFFALLMDFRDAHEEILPDDEERVRELKAGIAILNERYPSQIPRFSLFYRARKWNHAEQVFMGWERKRGKLREFNQLLRGKETSYIDDAKDLAIQFGEVHYVITLDEDTELVRDGAKALIGTIDHPLNRPIIDERSAVVTEGYGIIQPRSALRFREGNATAFSRLFGSFPGIESYSSLVSDLHQDLFGEGIFHGKGIYDVDAVEATMSDRIPENTVLSHDLVEGLYARVGIASGAHIFEGFPSNYREHTQRLHRWIRGDWQIITWLFRRGKDFSTIGRYRIFDNLRRSLLPVATVLAVIFSAFTPAEVSYWSTVALLSLGSGQLVSALLQMTTLTANWRLRVSVWARFELLIEGIGIAIAKTYLLAAFAIHNAIVTIDAVVRSMWRLMVSKKKLLEWQTAFEAASMRIGSIGSFVQFMWQSICISLVLIFLEFHRGSIEDPLASTWMFIWLSAPFCAALISTPLSHRAQLSKKDRLYLRKIAARTYWFFLDLATEDEQWLAPDHLQEEPRSKRHSHGLGVSPTNLGMYLLALAGGKAIGLSSISGFAERIARAFASMEKMPLHRGHFYNWYELKSLSPLTPEYVSSVDSANLALSLRAVEGALRFACQTPIIDSSLFEGLEAELSVLSESCNKMINTNAIDRNERKQLEEVRSATGESLALIQSAVKEEITPRGSDLVWSGVIHHAVRTRNALEVLRLEGKSERFDDIFLAARHVESVAQVYRDNIMSYMGYAMIPAASPVVGDQKLQTLYYKLSVILQRIPSINELSSGTVRTEIESVNMSEAIMLSELFAPEKERAQMWYTEILERLAVSEENAKEVVTTLLGAARSAEAYVRNMDFQFLYNSERGLFHIGYNSSTGKLDEAFYDLLASEANSASIVSIAKRDVSQKHWGYLGRKLIKSNRGDLLVASWAGSLFEYLGTSIYFDVPRESFWGVSAQRAIAAHRFFAKDYQIPWGMGESASSRMDIADNYHYQAFGEPSLGFKRDLSESIVVAPYTSALALSLSPHEVIKNFLHLSSVGASGSYGFYDAIDFTERRRMSGRETPGVPARVYYAHHQGFILSSIVNTLMDGWVRNMVALNPEMEVATQLLEEKMPEYAHGEKNDFITPVTRGVRPIQKIIESHRRYLPWRTSETVSLFQSSGAFFSRTTTTGAGESRFGDILVTRESSDMLRESRGIFFYLFDAVQGKTWTPTYMPMGSAGEKHSVSAGEEVVVFDKTEEGISTSLLVSSLPDAGGELRELTITNTRAKETILTFGVCAELALSRREEESSHPNYGHLFVATETVLGGRGIIASRQDPHDRNRIIVAGFLLAGDNDLDDVRAVREKEVFYGSPMDVARPPILRDLSRGDADLPHYTLDSVAGFAGCMGLRPKETRRIAFITVVGRSKDEVIARLKRYRSYKNIRSSAQHADVMGGKVLTELEITSKQADAYSALASMAIARDLKIRKNSPSLIRQWVLSLWKMGISGNHPIILVSVGGAADLPMVRQLLSCHAYFLKKGISVDIVIFNEHSGGYLKTFEDEIDFLLHMHSAHGEKQVSQIFHARAEQLSDLESSAILSAVSVLIDAKKGSLVDAVDRLQRNSAKKYPQKLDVRTKKQDIKDDDIAKKNTANLIFFNGIGGYEKETKEYVIFYKPDEHPPRPWSHIVANDDIGFLVTDRGMSFSWVGNSYDNKLTVQYNDPLSDHTGEAIYVRDDDSGACASPLPLADRRGANFEIRFGEGHCTYVTQAFGIHIELTMYLGENESIKYYQIRLINNGDTEKHLSLFGYFELLIGGLVHETRKHFSFDVHEGNMLVVTQNYWNQFPEKRVIAGVIGGADGWSMSREEFLGRHGMINDPAALKRKMLSSEQMVGEESALALHKRITLLPRETSATTFFLGESNAEELEIVLDKIYAKKQNEVVYQATKTTHNDTMLPLVALPDETLTLLINQFLPYQTLTSRIRGRLGFYQIGGAYGFRDQLQDGLALLWYNPSWVRTHILSSAAHQFREGDVLSWWQPHNDFGARTRLSDPQLWLPYVVLRYVHFTGDTAILDEIVPYIVGDIPDKADRQSVVGIFKESGEESSLYEHLVRAVERSLTFGPHGLPLIGGADWNDGMNRVGNDGQGESVWLGWFTISVLDDISELVEQRGDVERASRYRMHAREYRNALKKFGWDGRWYRRAFTDGGGLVGASGAKAFQLDSITQSWAYFVDGSTTESKEALRSAKDELALYDGHIPLAWPPLSRSILDLGTISDYPPGVRENASQYNHAALWLAQALFASGDPDAGKIVVDAVNPMKRSETYEKAMLYQGEPYAVAAEIYSSPTYPGRAGWTWYTASAGVMYRTVLEYILGIKREANFLFFTPSFPSGWNEASFAMPFGKSHYQISFEVKDDIKEPVHVFLDDTFAEDGRVALYDDEKVHKVLVLVKRSTRIPDERESA